MCLVSTAVTKKKKPTWHTVMSFRGRVKGWAKHRLVGGLFNRAGEPPGDPTNVFSSWWLELQGQNLNHFQVLLVEFCFVFLHKHMCRWTYCNTKQGPLNSCPSVLPTINDQDETNACWWQTGTNTERQELDHCSTVVLLLLTFKGYNVI